MRRKENTGSEGKLLGLSLKSKLLGKLAESQVEPLRNTLDEVCSQPEAGGPPLLLYASLWGLRCSWEMGMCALLGSLGPTEMETQGLAKSPRDWVWSWVTREVMEGWGQNQDGRT